MGEAAPRTFSRIQISVVDTTKCVYAIVLTQELLQRDRAHTCINGNIAASLTHRTARAITTPLQPERFISRAVNDQSRVVSAACSRAVVYVDGLAYICA